MEEKKRSRRKQKGKHFMFQETAKTSRKSIFDKRSVPAVPWFHTHFPNKEKHEKPGTDFA